MIFFLRGRGRGRKCKVFRQIFSGKLYTRGEKATTLEVGKPRFFGPRFRSTPGCRVRVGGRPGIASEARCPGYRHSRTLSIPLAPLRAMCPLESRGDKRVRVDPKWVRHPCLTSWSCHRITGQIFREPRDRIVSRDRNALNDGSYRHNFFRKCDHIRKQSGTHVIHSIPASDCSPDPLHIERSITRSFSMTQKGMWLCFVRKESTTANGARGLFAPPSLQKSF